MELRTDNNSAAGGEGGEAFTGERGDRETLTEPLTYIHNVAAEIIAAIQPPA